MLSAARTNCMSYRTSTRSEQLLQVAADQKTSSTDVERNAEMVVCNIGHRVFCSVVGVPAETFW